MNPLTVPGSPIHDQVFAGLKALQTEMTRFVPWFPYPRLGVAQLQAPEVNPQCNVVPEDQPLYLSCSPQSIINEVQFASYGTPAGRCGAFELGTCHLENSIALLTAACVGKNNCTFTLAAPQWPDPCVGTSKWLAAQVHCSAQTNNTHWNFTLLDPQMADFMGATNGRDVTINFSTTPEWMWLTSAPVNVSEDPTLPNWPYEAGTACMYPFTFRACLYILTYYLYW